MIIILQGMSNKVSSIIFVEGKSDQSLIKSLVETKFGINFDKHYCCKEQEMLIMETDGVNNMKDKIERQVVNKNGNNIKKVFIIRDADENKEAAEQSVKDIIGKYKDNDIIFDYHIITRPNDNYGESYGIIEDFFLDIVVKGKNKEFYQDAKIYDLVNTVIDDTKASRDFYSRKVKAVATSFVRFYNCKETANSRNDICSLMEKDEDIAKKLMEYNAIKEMLEKIRIHFSLELACN
jgi:hypothetical protein